MEGNAREDKGFGGANMTDHYDALGVKKDATEHQIKRAWRAKAGKLHPDKPGGNAARFDVIRKAYLVLSNPISRERYDRTGSDGEDTVDRAEQYVLQLFGQLIDKYMNEGKRFNFIELAKKSIRQQMTPVKQKLDAEKAIRNRLETLKKVVHTKEQDNLFTMRLTDKAKQFEAAIQTARDEMEVLENALKLVDIHQDDFREVAGEIRMDAAAFRAAFTTSSSASSG